VTRSESLELRGGLFTESKTVVDLGPLLKKSVLFRLSCPGRLLIGDVPRR
jgi:hypothetical protein